MTEIHPMATVARSSRSSMAIFLLVLIVGTAIDLSALYMLQHVELGPAARITIALAPLPANLILLAMVLRAIRRLDEFQKRVHFEAVVFAFLATGIAVFIYGYLEKAQFVGSFNTLLIWAFMAIFYGIGYFISANHYK